MPIWYGHRVGLWRAALGMLRGEPAVRFFPSEESDPLVALVREKLPSSAKAHDEAKRVSEATRRNNLRWTFVFWFALVAVMAGTWFLVRGTA